MRNLFMRNLCRQRRSRLHLVAAEPLGDIDGRVGVRDETCNARCDQATHIAFVRQYCRDNSQWARERSDCARSPKGVSALIA
jgi:hypothetical protein